MEDMRFMTFFVLGSILEIIREFEFSQRLH